MKKVLMWTMTPIVIASGIFFAFSRSAPPDQSAELKKIKEEPKATIYPVELVRADSQVLHSYVTATAVLQADRQVDIYSKMAGRIEALNVEEGQTVNEGDILMTLEAGDARLRLEQARVNLNKGKAEFERIERSYHKELVSTEEYETRKFQFENAKAEYEVAQYQIELTRVIAPFSGTIVARNVELGQTIQPSEKLLGLASLNPLKAEVFLPESKVALLKAGMSARFSKSEDFENAFSGSVSRIAPVVDRETGTVKVTVAATRVPQSIRPGAYVHVSIEIDSENAAVVIPKRALVFDGNQNVYVFMTRELPDTANLFEVSRVEVKVGAEEDGRIAVTRGLQQGDSVVLTGKESLKDGARVKDVNGSVTVAGK